MFPRTVQFDSSSPINGPGSGSGSGSGPRPPKASASNPSTAQVPARQDAKPRKPWLWNVVLLDDQEHSYEYVIRMVQELFSASPEKALQIAQMVDRDKRAVLLTTHKELAELKREQILSYGRDPQLAISKGSMTAVIEPAE
jgi:ATP-dependent Clp protease adaptor protein ClpS